jgi:hypothetical protein
MATGGMAGKIGRVTLWPVAFGVNRARVQYRHQSETLRWSGVSDEDAGGATDLSPIAVPMRFGPVRAGVAQTLNPRTNSVDPEGENMTVVTATTTTGTASIVSDNIVTTSATSFSGESRTTFTLSDGSTKRSSSVAYGDIFLPAITPTAAAVSMTDAMTTASFDVLAGDTIAPEGIPIKVAAVQFINAAGPTGSGAARITRINGGAAGGNNVTITRNFQAAGTFKLQYKPGTTDDLHVHGAWIDITLTISVAAGDPVITTRDNAATITTEQDFIDVAVLANDSIVPDQSMVIRAVQQTANSGALVASVHPTDNTVLRVARNAQAASATVRNVQYKPGTSLYMHTAWVNCGVTVQDASARWWHNLGVARGAGVTGANANDQLRSGYSYHNETNWRSNYENRIGFMDAFNGTMPGHKAATFPDTPGGPRIYHPDIDTIQTMDKMSGAVTNASGVGGNDTENDTIGSRSQLAWWSRNCNWQDGWTDLPNGTLLSWSMDMIGIKDVGPGEEGANVNGIWEAINTAGAGSLLRRQYTNMGRRLAKMITDTGTGSMNPKGHQAKYIFARMNHENNQSNGHQVYGPLSGATPERGRLYGQQYADAMDRAIGWIRDGMGTISANVRDNFHFMHAPARSGKLDLGKYATWCPTECDTLSVSYHPQISANTHANLTSKYFNAQPATSGDYALADILEAANATTIPRPMFFPEWSPKYNDATGPNASCPVSDQAVLQFYNWMKTNRQLVIADCFYWPHKVWDIDAYVNSVPSDTTGIGRRNWGRAGQQYTYRWFTANGPSTRVARTANPPPTPSMT